MASEQFQELDAELKKFDYYYNHSDDGSQWRNGVKEQARVQALIDAALLVNRKFVKALVEKYYRQHGAEFKTGETK